MILHPHTGGKAGDSTLRAAGREDAMAEDESPVREAVRDAVEEGETEKTPLVIFTGVPLIVGSVVGVVLAVALTIYFVLQ